MDRKRVADILESCGTLLELKGENAFRCQAYHSAARAILQLEGSLDELISEGKLGEVKGIGKTLVEKIEEIANTGKLKFHDDLLAEVPAGLVEMLNISGFGPKRIRQVHSELGISTVAELKQAGEQGTLAELKGFGEKLVAKILAGIAFLEKSGERVLYPIALSYAQELSAALAQHPSVRRIEIAGSLRRARSTIKDIDLLIASDDPEPIMKAFVEHPAVKTIVGHGTTRSSVTLETGLNADLRVVAPEHFPFALHYFTGSKEHNVAVRALAQEKGYKLNEYELVSGDKRVPCKDEADLFAALGLDYVAPELREDTGEIDAARNHTLPNLIRYADITGTFHCHTNASDGSATLEEMAAAAQSAGFSYLGIADHSQSAAYARGLEPERVRDQHQKIDALNKKFAGSFRLFKGIESDIRADGSLDYDDDILDSFDYIVASIHQPLNMDEKTMTERVIRAMEHPRCTMIGHLTGRILLHRDGYPIDIEAILKAAVKNDVMIEINANPHRMDLDWMFCKRAKQLGVMLVINPDAHATRGIEDVRFGVAHARRGWLEAKNVFNTLPLAEIEKELEKRKTRSSKAR